MKEESKLPYGGAVFSFDTMEEFFAHQAKSEAAANANVVSAQREIGYGSYVIRLVPDLVIWGRIPTYEEVCATERKYYPAELIPGSEEDYEYAEVIAGVQRRFERGYRYGFWSSEIEPGEWGDAHISTLWKITEEDYEIAQRNDWKLWPELALRLKRDFRDAEKERNERNEQDH